MTINKKTDDLKIASMKELIEPVTVINEIPMSDKATNNVLNAREEIVKIITRQDKRMLVVVGPCSIHDVDAAMEYASRLMKLKNKVAKNILVVMRVYFEKPRTVIGWKGLINDPDLDNSFKINKGIKIARKLLLELAEMGMPAGHEYLDLISPQYIADLISWGAIGARTTESQSHRELASGLSCPVGFKNGTDGSIQIAIDAINAASKEHNFLSVTKQGKSAIFTTKGNNDCHVILRGGKNANYKSSDVKKVSQALKDNKLHNCIVIDASHSNSQKDFSKQKIVVYDVIEQLKSAELSIGGIMLESNLVEGKQDIKNKSELVFGQSITDACIGWEETEKLITDLNEAMELINNEKN
tara:strand:+ start:225 stop:1292 length:1068 start_codon:yes stop_codon:yes gene_type:complete